MFLKHLKSISIGWLAFSLITCGHTEEPVKDPTLSRVSGLPDILIENSGMTEYGNLLWNINDGGGEAAIYGFNPKDTLQPLQKIVINEAINTDWEDITQDDSHLYIGDFGNNLGDRRDLRIYILNKSDLLPSSDSITVAGIISFSFGDQTDFTTAENYTTPWDCEAFVAIDDSLVLFTKDWQSNHTRVYTLPATAGNHIARFRKEYDISGLVTASAWSKSKRELLLLGYLNYTYTPFIEIVPDFGLNNFSFADTRKINYDFFGTQTEGIAYSADGTVYVSCEKSLVLQTLFKAEF